MKFETQSLLSAVSVCNKATKRNQVLTVCENIAVNKAGETTTVMATDLHTTVVVDYKSNTKGDYQFLISPLLQKAMTGKKEMNITMPDQITMSVVFDDNDKLETQCDKYGDFPDIQIKMDWIVLEVTKEFISNLKPLIAFATTDEMRPEMTGVSVIGDKKKKQVVLCGSDGHILKKVVLDKQKVLRDFKLIIQKDTIKILSELKLSYPGSLAIGESEIMFDVHDASKILDIKIIQRHLTKSVDKKHVFIEYPDFNKVIPTDQQSGFVVNRKKFIEKLKSILVWTNQTTNQIFIHTGNASITAVNHDNYSNYSKSFELLKQRGVNVRFAINCKFLIKVLSEATGDEVEITYSTKEDALQDVGHTVTKPITIEEKNEFGRVTLLIMPVIIY